MTRLRTLFARGTCLALAGTCGILAHAAPPTAGADASFEVAREQAVGAVVTELDVLADWCQKKRLYGRRDQVLDAVLHFVPDDEVRRRRLKYTKEDGEWVRAASYKTPRDYGKTHLDAFRSQLTEIATTYRETLAQYTADNLAMANTVWDDILAFDSDNAPIREARGEAQHPTDGRWVLVETVRALARRAQLQETSRQLLKDIKPDEVELDAFERELGVKWRAVLSTRHARVLGTGSPKESAACARHVEAAIQLFAYACETEADVPLFTVYLITTEDAAAQFLDNHPRLQGRERTVARKTSSYWVGLHGVVIWPTPDGQCLDEAVRLANALMMVNGYPLTTDQGWALEGVGTALSTLLLGDRAFRPFDRPGDVPSKLRAPVRIAERWRNHYAHTGIAELLDQPASALNRDARERATVLARFFLEARPGDLTRVLRSIGEGSPSRVALESVLSMKLPRIESFVLRWLDESV